jgi:hypothetical protein
MNAKALIPLALILVVLVGLVLLRQQGKEVTTIIEQAALESLVPDDLTQDDIRRITLYQGEAEDAEKVVLAREDAKAPWRVASQFDAPAIGNDVDKFLGVIFDIQGDLREEASSDEGLARYQLKDDEAIHLVLATEDTAEAEPALHLLLGKQANSTLFIRRAGEMAIYDEQAQVREETGVFGEGQQPTASKWVNKDILGLEADAQIVSVAATLPDKAFTLAEVEVEVPVDTPAEESTEGEAAEVIPAEPQMVREWQVTEGGPGLELKTDTWSGNVNRLTTLRATDVVDPADLSAYGLDNPAYRTTLKIRGQENEIVLEGGRPEKNGDGYLRVAGVEPPVVYKLFGSNFELAFPKTGTLFDYPKFGEGATTDTISRIEVVKAGSPALVIEPENESWKIVQPALELPAQETTLTQIATTITSATPADYAGEGVETGPYDWTITAMVNGEARTLHLGADSTAIDGVYARYGDNPAVYTLARTDANKLMITPDKAFQTALFDATVDTVQGVVFQGAEQRLVLTKVGEDWQMAEGAVNYPVDTVKARSFITSAIGLQGDALRLDAPTALPGDALYTVEVMTEGGREQAQFGADPADAARLLAYTDGLPVALGETKSNLEALDILASAVVESKIEPAAPEEADGVEETTTTEEAIAVESEMMPTDTAETGPLEVEAAPMATGEATPLEIDVAPVATEEVMPGITKDDAAALASPNTPALSPAE